MSNLLAIDGTGAVTLLTAEELELYRSGTDKDREALDLVVQRRKAECRVPCTLRGLLCEMGCNDWGCNAEV